MTKTKPHILDKDKKKFKRFLVWIAPHTPRTGIVKLRKVFYSLYGLTNRWIEFKCLQKGDDNSKVLKIQGILTGCLWREDSGRDFCIELRDVFYDGKPVISDRRTNKHLQLCFSAEEIYKVNCQVA